MDEVEDDDACEFVDVEHLSDNNNFELVDAKRNRKEFLARNRLKIGANIEAAGTSQ